MLAAVGQQLVDNQRMVQSPAVVAGVIVMIVGGSPRNRNRVEVPPEPPPRGLNAWSPTQLKG